MVSKQQLSKESQGYRLSPKTCSNCSNYSSEIETKDFGQYVWTEEKNKRCKIGGFAVKKTAVCDLWEEILKI